MMNPFHAMRMRSAAKRYAERLGPSLNRSFGWNSTYTPKQIQRGISDCTLDPRYIVFAYAAFLPEAEFDMRVSDMPIKLPYREARDLYFRFVRAKPGLTFGGVQGVGDGSIGGGADGD
jgi:hypothetical protein